MDASVFPPTDYEENSGQMIHLLWHFSDDSMNHPHEFLFSSVHYRKEARKFSRVAEFNAIRW